MTPRQGNREQSSLDYKQRLQQLFFPKESRSTEIDSIEPRNRAIFQGLAPSESADERVVNRIFASWNQLDEWLLQVDALRRVA